MSTTIRGYACIFNRQFQPDGPSPLIVKPGAFDVSRSVPILLDHDPRKFVAASAGVMRLWQDATGLAFELDADDAHFDHLANQVERRARASLSVCFPKDRKSEYRNIGDERVEIIAQTKIEEISFLETGACPGAVAWLAVDGIDLAPAHILDEQRRWTAGFQKQILSSQRRNYSPPSEPAGVVPLSARAPSNSRQCSPSSGPVALSPQSPVRKSKPRVPDSVVALMASAQWPKLVATVSRGKSQVPPSVEKLLRLRGALASGNDIIGHATVSIFPEVALQMLTRRDGR